MKDKKMRQGEAKQKNTEREFSAKYFVAGPREIYPRPQVAI
jgi:hypothetical protein